MKFEIKPAEGKSIVWSKKDWVDDQMQYKLFNVNQPPEGTPAGDPLACVAQKTPKNMGKVFQIYLNYGERDPAISDPFYMHECGHIIFGHLNKNLNEDPEIIRGIIAAYKKVKDIFPVSEQNRFLQYFKTTVYNIIQDFEVNSKLFSEEEFDAVETIASAMIGNKVTLCWPERYGYPVGKDWMYYLNAILRDPEKFLENMQNEQNSGNDSKDGDSDEQSEGQGQGQSGGKGQSGGGSKQDNGSLFNDENESQDEGSSSSGSGDEEGEGASNSDEEGDDSSDEAGEENESKSSGSGDESGESEGLGSRDATHEFGHGAAGSSSAGSNGLSPAQFAQRVMQALEKYAEQQSKETKDRVATEIENAVLSEMGGSLVEVEPQMTMRDILNLISKKLKKADVAKSRRDVMYNYNRGKLGTGKQTIIPRPVNDKQERKGSMICMIDVSGSVSSEFVQEVVSNFAFMGKKLGKDTRIITCGDEVLSDVTVEEAKLNGVEVGGGTDLKVGFRYINNQKYVRSKDDIFFLISDLEDFDPEGFNVELKALKATKYCIFIDSWRKTWTTEVDLGLFDEYYKYDPNVDGLHL